MTREEETLAKQTLMDKRQFNLTVSVMILTAFVLGLVIGLTMGVCIPWVLR